MGRNTDLRFLWGIGASMLIFGGVGIAGAASIVALPLYLAVFAGLSEKTAFAIFLYSAPIWAPIGFGMGGVAAGTALRGVRRKSQPGGERIPKEP